VDDFQKKLFIEKRRVERLNLETSLVTFKFSEFFDNINKKNKNIININNVLYVICNNIRKTDVVSLFDESTILILLPETDSKGAQVMCNRVTRIINENLEKEFFIKENNNIEIDILSYPKETGLQKQKNSISEDKKENTHDRDFIPANPSKEMNFNQQCFETSNLCFSTNNGATLSTPLFNIFFWDQEFISDLSFLLKKLTKRLIDILGAIILLIIFSPFMLTYCFSII